MISAITNWSTSGLKWVGDHTHPRVTSAVNSTVAVAVPVASGALAFTGTAISMMQKAMIIKTAADAVFNDSVKEAEKKQEAQDKSDGQLRAKMRTQGERIRSLSPKSCEVITKQYDEMMGRFERTAQSAEVVAQYQKLYDETVAQCGG